MNKELAELKVHKSADYYDKVIKVLEEAGFVLVLTAENSVNRYYIVAEKIGEEFDEKHGSIAEMLKELKRYRKAWEKVKTEIKEPMDPTKNKDYDKGWEDAKLWMWSVINRYMEENEDNE